MPLDAEKIKEFRDQVLGVTSRKKKISTIAGHQLAVSIPIVLQIHLDISRTLEEKNLISQIDVEQQLFIKKSIDGFVKADEKINPGFFGAIRIGLDYLTTDEYTKDFIVNNLDAMAAMAEKMIVPNSVVDLWKEAAIWYRGMYQHVRNLVKDKDGNVNKDQDGLVLIPGDEDDEKFKAWVGLTKYSIAEYYHQFSRIINQRVKESVDDSQLLARHDELADKPYLEPTAIKLFEQRTKLIEFSLCAYLQQHHNDVVGNRIAALKFAFANKRISHADEKRIESKYPQLIQSIEKYANSWTRTNGYTPSIWGRAHRNDIAVAKQGIENEALHSRKVLKLIGLWEQVAETDNSELRKRLEPQLNNLFSFLEKELEPEVANAAGLS